MTVENTKIIELPKFLDARGNLSFIEQNNHIPFEIKRTYWIYDVPGGESRGGHAFKDTEEFIIALSGSFNVIGLWREIDNFSTNSLALEFASTKYNPTDYIRHYDEYLKLKDDEKI